MLRIYFIITFFISTILPISIVAQSYTVTATFPDGSFKGKTVYLSAVHDGSILDSTVIADQKAIFKGEAENTTLCMVASGNVRGFIMLEKGNITVNVSSERGALSYGKGTLLNSRLGGLMEKYNQLMGEVMNYQGEDEEEFMKTVWTPKFTQGIGGIFKANSNNDIGMRALMYLSNYGESDSLDTFFEQAGETVTSRGPIQKIIKQRQALKQTAEGMMFTDFTIENSDGQSVSFSDYIGKGKYVLVDFWAGWCGPCKREIPHIKEIYEKYNGDNFTVLGVAVWEQPAATKKVIKELGIIWPSIINAQSIPIDIYGIDGIPHIILFGPDGTIVARGLRGEDMKTTINKILSEEAMKTILNNSLRNSIY